MNDAQIGYGSMRASTASPRTTERAILRRLAAEIEGASSDYARLAQAVQRNGELWTTLAVDLASPGNALPASPRAQLISLAGFVLRHSRSVLAGEAEPGVLADLNRTIADGLDKAALSEAA